MGQDGGTRFEVEYFPARTVVKIDGTLTRKMDAEGNRDTKRASEVSIGVEADDQQPPLKLSLDAEWWNERELSLDFAADRRLTGASYASKGLGGQVVGAALHLIALAAKLALRFGVTEHVDLDAELESDDPVLARRRKEFAKVIELLQDRLVAVGTAAAADDADPDLHDRLELVQDALAAARGEAAVLDTRFDAWRKKRFPPSTQSLTYLLGTDQLVERERAEPVLELEEGELAGDALQAREKLGVVVARIGGDPTDHSAPDGDGSIVYRVPLRIELAVYEESDEPQQLELRKVIPVWVVDSLSEHREIPLRAGFFSEHGATVQFGDAGTLTKLSNKESAAGAIEAVSGVGATVSGALEQGGKIADAFPAPEDPALKALKDEVDRKELEAKLVAANRTIAGTS